MPAHRACPQANNHQSAFYAWKIHGELEHLQRLRHAHIVQLVGSYVQGREFAILLYPCADMDLSNFMKEITGELIRDGWNAYIDERILALQRFLSCLSQALAYIHSQTSKHMDIKPS